MKMAKRTTRPTEKYRAVFFFIALANLAYFIFVQSSILLVTRLFSGCFETHFASRLNYSPMRVMGLFVSMPFTWRSSQSSKRASLSACGSANFSRPSFCMNTSR